MTGNRKFFYLHEEIRLLELRDATREAAGGQNIRMIHTKWGEEVTRRSVMREQLAAGVILTHRQLPLRKVSVSEISSRLQQLQNKSVTLCDLYRQLLPHHRDPSDPELPAEDAAQPAAPVSAPAAPVSTPAAPVSAPPRGEQADQPLAAAPRGFQTTTQAAYVYEDDDDILLPPAKLEKRGRSKTPVKSPQPVEPATVSRPTATHRSEASRPYKIAALPPMKPTRTFDPARGKMDSFTLTMLLSHLQAEADKVLRPNVYLADSIVTASFLRALRPARSKQSAPMNIAKALSSGMDVYGVLYVPHPNDDTPECQQNGHFVLWHFNQVLQELAVHNTASSWFPDAVESAAESLRKRIDAARGGKTPTPLASKLGPQQLEQECGFAVLDLLCQCLDLDLRITRDTVAAATTLNLR